MAVKHGEHYYCRVSESDTTVDRGDPERLPTTAFGWDGAVGGNRDESHRLEAASQSGVGK